MKITRRQFVKMAAYAAAATGVSQFDITKLQKALAATGDQIPVIWFEGLGDSGCVVSLANYFDGASSGIESVLLNNIELKFNSVLMGASGQLAIDEAEKVFQGEIPYDQPYVLVVTGAVANVDGYCIALEDTTLGGTVPDGVMQMVDAYSRWQLGAAYVLFVGSCACYGGVNTISGDRKEPWNPDGQNVSLASLPDHAAAGYGENMQIENFDYDKSVYIPGCPAHPDWIVLTIVHLLTDEGTNKIATLDRDRFGRPRSILGLPSLFHQTVHENCPRKTQHDVGEFADHVGDTTGKCLVKVGCRGKETFCPCPVQGWNSADIYNSGKLAYCNAPGINHLCIGCTQPFFPDVPFNRGINNIDTTP
jgi:hydrogenase small subunit